MHPESLRLPAPCGHELGDQRLVGLDGSLDGVAAAAAGLAQLEMGSHDDGVGPQGQGSEPEEAGHHLVNVRIGGGEESQDAEEAQHQHDLEGHQAFNAAVDGAAENQGEKGQQENAVAE